MSDRMPVTVLNQHSAHKAEAKAQGVLDLATVVGRTKTSPIPNRRLYQMECVTPFCVATAKSSMRRRIIAEIEFCQFYPVVAFNIS